MTENTSFPISTNTWVWLDFHLLSMNFKPKQITALNTLHSIIYTDLGVIKGKMKFKHTVSLSNHNKSSK